MSKTVKNAKEMPKVYFGLHMTEGVAEYPEHAAPDGKPTRILILENTLKEMNPTFSGKPIYVQHVDAVDLTKLQSEADGYVIESFYNKTDGKHWAKFIVVSDEGHQAVRNGWKLSNAYRITQTGAGGTWHAVDYNQEVLKGEYGHLAIVPNPRYEESIILTPEQFKAYNSKKEQELFELANSKRGKSMFNFFKRSKVENSEEIASAIVTLSTGKEVSIKDLINAAEEKEKEIGKSKDEPVMANGEHLVEVGKTRMSVNELAEKYQALLAPANAETDEEKAKREADEKKNAEETAAKEAEEKKNAEEKAAKESTETLEAEEKKKAEAEALRKKNSLYFDMLKNAGPGSTEDLVLETSVERAARGQSRYGSGK